MRTSSIVMIATLFLGTVFSAGTTSRKESMPRTWKGRNLNTKNGADSLTITSVSNTTNPRTVSTWTISSARGGDLRIRSTYSATNTSDASKETERSSMMTRLSAIVEYLDSNGNNQFDSGEGIQIYRIGLGSNRTGVIPRAPIAGQGIDWTRTYTPASTEDGINTFSAKTVDGVFEASVKFSSVKKTIDGAIVPPTAIKFNVLINLPATWYNDTTGKSRIALLASVLSANGVVSRAVDASVATATITKSVAAGENLMAWADVITADGKEVPVLSSNVVTRANMSADLVANAQNGNAAVDRAGEGESFVIFSFDAVQPKSLVWDPTIGLDASLDSTTSSASSAAASAVILALAFIVAAMM